MRQHDFVLIVAALKAGQLQSARGTWEAIQARKEQDGGRRETFPRKRTKDIPIKRSLSPAPDAHAPGGSLSHHKVVFPGAWGWHAVCHMSRKLFLSCMVMIWLKYQYVLCP